MFDKFKANLLHKSDMYCFYEKKYHELTYTKNELERNLNASEKKINLIEVENKRLVLENNQIKTELNKLKNDHGQLISDYNSLVKSKGINTKFITKYTEEEEYFTPLEGLDITPYLHNESKQGMYHLSRYHWVKDVLKAYKSKKILDIACGAGYGSFIIADHLPNSSVTGVDYDRKAINISKTSYTRSNLDYSQGDIVSWTKIEKGQHVPLGKYDAIVCFDTIEHIAHREIALMRIAENLNEDGILALSTPIRPHNLLNPPWQEHMIEYCPTDLKKFVSYFFREVLLSEENNLPNIRFFNDVVNKDEMRYHTNSNPIICTKPITKN